MADLEVTCSRCGSALHHECHPETLGEAAVDLFAWRPERGFPRALKRGNANCDGSEDEKTVPFLTEAFLYPLLGKDDARSLLGRVHALFRAMGIDPHHLEVKASERLEQEKRDVEAERQRRAENKKQYRELMKPVEEIRLRGYWRCRYQSFYCFDVNVSTCAGGECFQRADANLVTKYKKPNVGEVLWNGDAQDRGLEVSCRVCKRVHSATPEQVARWREEKQYRARPAGPRGLTNPEDWIHTSAIAAALGFKRAS